MELIWCRVTLNAGVSKSYQTVDSDPITFHPTFDMLIYIFDVDGAVKGTNTDTFLTFCLFDWNQYPLWLSWKQFTTRPRRDDKKVQCLYHVYWESQCTIQSGTIYVPVNWPFRSLIIYEIHRFKKQHEFYWLVMTLTFDI